MPLPAASHRFHAWKIAKRFDQDISGVCGAWNLDLDGGRVRDIRICYGGMAATPKRATNCERALVGEVWSEAALAPALRALEQDYAPISDMRASGRYRMLVARNLLHKFYRETTAEEGDGHVALWGT